MINVSTRAVDTVDEHEPAYEYYFYSDGKELPNSTSAYVYPTPRMAMAAGKRQLLIDESLDQALTAIPQAIGGNWQKAMFELHSQAKNTQ